MSDTPPFQPARPAAELANELRDLAVRFARTAREILENTGPSPHLTSAVEHTRAAVSEVHAHLDAAHAAIRDNIV